MQTIQFYLYFKKYINSRFSFFISYIFSIITCSNYILDEKIKSMEMFEILFLFLLNLLFYKSINVFMKHKGDINSTWGSMKYWKWRNTMISLIHAVISAVLSTIW